MQPSKTPATMLALIFLMLMLASLGLRFWAGNQEYKFTGPTHIAAGGGQVWLYAAEELIHLTESGQIVAEMPQGTTGINDVPIDLKVLGDGRLLVAEQSPALIRRCDVEPWHCEPVYPEQVSKLKRQFKVLRGSTGRELIVTDAPGDTLWRFSETPEPQKLLPDRTLAGPNDLAFGSAGNLWIADTDNRRIVEFTPQEDRAFQPGREHSAVNDLTIGKRYYPMSLALAPDDRLWVIQATEFSEALADVVIYDAEEGAQAVIDLPKGAYPTDIVLAGEAMLVTDLERYSVYRIDSKTLAVSEFGGDDFRNRLQEIRENRKHYEFLGTGALAAIVLFAVLMILAAVRATPKKKRWTEPPGLLDIENAAEQIPETQGIHWLKRDPGFDRSLKWIEWLYFGALAGYFVMAVVLYGLIKFRVQSGSGGEWSSKTDELGIALLLLGFVLASFWPSVRARILGLKQKLGTDGKYLYFRLSDGRELSVEPARLFYTKQAILYRQYAIPLLGMKQKSIYISGEAQTWLAPMLRSADSLSVIEGLKYRWNNRNSELLWSVATGIVMVLVLLLMQTILP